MAETETVLGGEWDDGGYAYSSVRSRVAVSGVYKVAFLLFLQRWLMMGRFYLIAASLGGTTCPLAMTDGAARCLELHGPKEVQDISIPRLTAVTASELWTS